MYDNTIEITNSEKNNTSMKLLKMFHVLKQLANSKNDIEIDQNEFCIYLTVGSNIDYAGLNQESINRFNEFDKLLMSFLHYHGIYDIETDIITSTEIIAKDKSVFNSANSDE